MSWYLLFVMLNANVPHTRAMLLGPFPSKQECVRHEFGFSNRWCVAGCMSFETATATIAELASKPPSPTCDGIGTDE
jgi:hypothetical protein